MFVLRELRCGLWWGVLTLCLGGWHSSSRADEPSARVATVNSHVILQRDVDLELLVSGRRTPTPEDRQAALERVIDRTLILYFIASKGTDPLAEDVENLVQFVRTGVESGGDKLEAVLQKLKLTEDDVRRAARITISWQAYVRRTVTDKEIRAHFEQHREQYDGTQVHLRQIVRTVASTGTPAEWNAAEKLLADLRPQIQTGKLDFAVAAATHSQSPGAKNGGDVGFIRYHGDVPAAVAKSAFALKPGETSAPVRSTVGVHLVQVTDRRPGELSLEDARPAVLDVLGDQLWESSVKSLREKAKIVRAGK